MCRSQFRDFSRFFFAIFAIFAIFRDFFAIFRSLSLRSRSLAHREIANGTRLLAHRSRSLKNAALSEVHRLVLFVKSRKIAKTAALLRRFIARSSSGFVTTLGRNGSDYTGALVAASLGCSRFVVNTDVAGIYTAEFFSRKIRVLFVPGYLYFSRCASLFSRFPIVVRVCMLRVCVFFARCSGRGACKMEGADRSGV